MSTVYIGFSTPSSFNPISWLVRKLTKSTVSHTWFLYYDADLGMNMVMEAHELGFRLIPFFRFKKYNNIVALFRPEQDLNIGLRWAAQWLGTAYDFGGLIGMAAVLIGRIFNKKLHNPLQNSHAMFCSEIAMDVLSISGVKWADDFEPSEVSPDDLMTLLAQFETSTVI